MRSRKLGLILSYMNTFLNMALGLFLSAFLLRVVGDTEYGVYKTVSSFAGMLVLFEFGTGTVMIKNLTICRAREASQEEINRNVSTILTITNFLAIAIFTASVLFWLLLGTIYRNSLTFEQIQYGKVIFVFVSLHLIASFYYQTLNGIIIAYEFYAYASVVSIATILSRTILLVCILLKFRYSIVIAMVDALIAIITDICSIVFCKKNCAFHYAIASFDKTIFKQALPLCCAIFLQAIVNQANSNVDNFLIGIKLNPESVSLYSIGLYIYSVFSSLTTIPISMYAPQVIKTVTQGVKGKELTDSLIQPCRLVMITGGLVLFGFVSCGKQFICIVYGENYVKAWSVAVLIMVPMMVNMANGVLINVLDAMNKRMVRSKVLVATTITNILLTLIWLDRWGVIGAAAATAVATLFGQIFTMNLYYSKRLNIKVIHLFRETFRGILSYQLLGMAVALLVGRLISSAFTSFVCCGAIFVIVFIGGFLFRGKNQEEKELLSKFAKRSMK